MKFLTLSQKQIKNSAIYNSIQEKHVVISITSAEDEEITIPFNTHRVSQLYLKFDDVQDIDSRYIYFDRSMANQILEFVEKYINSVSLIIVQCQAGLSRSVAIAAALSKIINYTDDNIYTKGIPNMFVYTTLLDELFGNRYWSQQYPRIYKQRNSSMAYFLTPATIRLNAAVQQDRLKD